MNTLPMTAAVKCLVTLAVAQLNMIMETISMIQRALADNPVFWVLDRKSQESKDYHVYMTAVEQVPEDLLRYCYGLSREAVTHYK